MFPGTRLGGAKLKEASPTPKSSGSRGLTPRPPEFRSEVGNARGSGAWCGRGRLETHPLPSYQRVEGRGLGAVGHVVAIALRAPVGAPIDAQRRGGVELVARGGQQPALVDRAVDGRLGRGGGPGVGQRAAARFAARAQGVGGHQELGRKGPRGRAGHAQGWGPAPSPRAQGALPHVFGVDCQLRQHVRPGCPYPQPRGSQLRLARRAPPPPGGFQGHASPPPSVPSLSQVPRVPLRGSLGAMRWRSNSVEMGAPAPRYFWAPLLSLGRVAQALLTGKLHGPPTSACCLLGLLTWGAEE